MLLHQVHQQQQQPSCLSNIRRSKARYRECLSLIKSLILTCVVCLPTIRSQPDEDDDDDETLMRVIRNSRVKKANE